MPMGAGNSIRFARLALWLGVCSAVLVVWQATVTLRGMDGNEIAGSDGWVVAEMGPNSTVGFGPVRADGVPAVADTIQQPEASDDTRVFHFVHTTDDSSFSERNLWALESVFFHHPKARVVVHVHNLTEGPLAPLLEKGYRIRLRPIDLEATAEALLSALPQHLLDPAIVKDFLREIPSNYSATPYWYTNQSNLLRLALMFLEGGVYLDTDVILVRPLYPDGSNHIGLRTTNVLGWEDKHRIKINMAVMKFSSPGNSFLADCLREFFTEFRPLIWGHNGPKLVTRVFRRWSSERMIDGVTNENVETTDPERPVNVLYGDNGPNHHSPNQNFRASTREPVLNVLDFKAFYPIRANNVRKWCLGFHGEEVTLRKTHRIRQGSFAVHTNNKNTGTALVQPGSVCDWLYSSFRVTGIPANFTPAVPFQHTNNG